MELTELHKNKIHSKHRRWPRAEDGEVTVKGECSSDDKSNAHPTTPAATELLLAEAGKHSAHLNMH